MLPTFGSFKFVNKNKCNLDTRVRYYNEITVNLYPRISDKRKT